MYDLSIMTYCNTSYMLSHYASKLETDIYFVASFDYL